MQDFKIKDVKRKLRDIRKKVRKNINEEVVNHPFKTAGTVARASASGGASLPTEPQVKNFG